MQVQAEDSGRMQVPLSVCWEMARNKAGNGQALHAGRPCALPAMPRPPAPES